MLRDEVERFTRLSGEDRMSTRIIRIGSYLDGYDRGVEDLINRINEWLDPDIDMELALERIRAIVYEETHND